MHWRWIFWYRWCISILRYYCNCLILIWNCSIIEVWNYVDSVMFCPFQSAFNVTILRHALSTLCSKQLAISPFLILALNLFSCIEIQSRFVNHLSRILENEVSLRNLRLVYRLIRLLHISLLFVCMTATPILFNPYPQLHSRLFHLIISPLTPN